MSLFSVPCRPFPRFLSSPSAQSSRPSASTTSIARIRCNSPSAGLRWSESGRMADSAPNTVYENKLANLISYTPTTNSCAQTTRTSPEGLPNSGASSSSKQTAASSLWKQGARHVSGRSGLWETGAELDRESVAATILNSLSKGKRDRDTNVVHSLKDRDILQKILERKVGLAVRGERVAQQKLYEAQSRIWISAISATSSKSIGRSGSKRQN